MSSENLGALIERAARHPLLTAADEARLADRLKRGDLRARDELIESNIRLVIALARSFRGRGVPLPDLVQDGMVGLIRAVERFDHRRGARFATYAAWWIRREMLRALADDRTIRMPATAARQLAAIRHAESELERPGHAAPSGEELARRTGLRPRRVDELRQAAHVAASLDATVAGTETALGELVASEDDASTAPWRFVDAREDRERVLELVHVLPARHREVLERRFGLAGRREQSHREIAQGLGVSEERSRQIEHQALHWLRTLMTQRSQLAA